MSTKPLITAHSGGLGVAANTLAYLEKAAAAQPDVIEIDIRRTADGIPVLSHDTFLPLSASVLGNGQREICRQSFCEAKEAWPELLNLQEALDFFAAESICLNLDIKELEAIRPTVEKMRNYPVAPVFSGCGRAEVRELLALRPEARALYNMPPPNSAEWQNYSQYLSKAIGTVKELECFGINICHKFVKAELVSIARDQGIPVFSWTVNDKAEMQRLVNLGVYSITTDEVGFLQSLIAEFTQ